MVHATRPKNAVKEVVAMRELVHWVTALVALVSLPLSIRKNIYLFLFFAWYFFLQTIIAKKRKSKSFKD